MTHVAVVALGQPLAGDDGVGWLVADLLAGAGARVVKARDASAIVDVDARSSLIIVDAFVVAERGDLAVSVGMPEPGAVVTLRRKDIDWNAVGTLSSHAISVGKAVRLAEAMNEVHAVGVVGVCIPPVGGTIATRVSAVVAAAAPEAARQVRLLIEEAMSEAPRSSR